MMFGRSGLLRYAELRLCLVGWICLDVVTSHGMGEITTLANFNKYIIEF
jgi:hypothetical protein